MMEIEKNLAKTDLNQFKEAPLKMFAKGCIQYQDFKQSIAINMIGECATGWSKSSRSMYFNGIKNYLKTGVFNGRTCSVKLKEQVDELLKSKKYVALTPSNEDRAKDYKPRKYKVVVPKKVVEELITVTAPACTNYGVKINNTIKLFPTKDACMAYIECYREFDNTKDLAIVNLSIKYI